MREKRKVKLIRQWTNEKESIGYLSVVDEKGMPIFASIALERGDLDNRKNVSNIPAGTYPLKLTYSPKFKRKMWLVDKVPGRSGIRIHPANYWNQLQGCIAPGLKLKDLNKDGLIDVTYSSNTTKAFETALRGLNETTIEIIDSY
jgi:hypothetical protein